MRNFHSLSFNYNLLSTHWVGARVDGWIHRWMNTWIDGRKEREENGQTGKEMSGKREGFTPGEKKEAREGRQAG